MKHTCPICGKEYEKENMEFSRDYYGIPFRLVCIDCLDKIESDVGYDGQYYSEFDECIDEDY